MENITLGQISIWLAFAIGLYTSVKFIVNEMGKAIDKGLEPINKKIDTVDMNATKNFLVSQIHDIKKGETLDDISLERFTEQYDHYRALGGNSYIVNEVEKLKKANKL